MERDQLADRYDVAVIGGGINGAGIARDAAGRGLKVLLCEQDDLAGHTSSSSTKLIHGGLRYLEHLEFGLVRKALAEREVLLNAAPHIIRPLRFVVPHDAHLRPVWMIRLGLFFYDHLARRERLASSRYVNLHNHIAGAVLDRRFHKGFEYSDAWVDDARLVVLNCVDAAERGAHVVTRTKCVSALRQEDHWTLTLRSHAGQESVVAARALVNATGPWVRHFSDTNLVDAHLDAGKTAQARPHTRRRIRLVKGSHIVLPKLFDHPYAYLFQNPDKRIIFAIPFEQSFTLVGTTDVEYEGDPAACRIDDHELDYLCEMANRYFARPVSKTDVVWSYSGVRPLLDDAHAEASSVTRDYTLELNTEGPPILSVFGGKITTYRRLAEEAVNSLQEPLQNTAGNWTAKAALPGGDIAQGDLDAYCRVLAARYAQMPAPMLRRYAAAYGTRIEQIIGEAATANELGAEIAPQLYERELHHLVQNEWARCAEDVLWRRSKLGLHSPTDAAAKIDAWLQTHYPHLHVPKTTTEEKA